MTRIRPSAPMIKIATDQELICAPFPIGCKATFVLDTFICKQGLSLTVFGVFSWLRKRFHQITRPPVRPGYDDNYRSRNYGFVERGKETPFSSELRTFFFCVTFKRSTKTKDQDGFRNRKYGRYLLLVLSGNAFLPVWSQFTRQTYSTGTITDTS